MEAGHQECPKHEESDDDFWLLETLDGKGYTHSLKRRRLRWQRYLTRLGHADRCETPLPKRSYPRMDWKVATDFLTEKEFTRYYKLDKGNFANVLQRLVPHMKKVAPTNELEREVPFEIEFGCTLRWLAGGNYMDIAKVHGISETAFWRAIHATILALLIEYAEDELGDAKFYDVDRLQAMEKTFREHNGGLIKGCVGAIDGMAVRINRPSEKECPNPMSYYSRKGFFAVVLQAICDGNCRFLWGSVRCPGGTHDSTAWTITELCRCVLYTNLNDITVKLVLIRIESGQKL